MRGWVVVAVIFLLGVWLSPQVKGIWHKVKG